MDIRKWLNDKFNFGSDDEPENTPTPEEIIKKWADEPQDPPRENGKKED